MLFPVQNWLILAGGTIARMGEFFEVNLFQIIAGRGIAIRIFRKPAIISD